MKHVMQTIGRGQAGVYRVASELILRNHVPYFPGVDTAGVDLIVDGSLRVQVKTTLRATKHWRYPEGTFSFPLTHCQRIKNRKYETVRARTFSDECDLVVLWAIEPNKFWIVPASVLDRRYTVTINDRTQWKSFDADEARRLRASGATWKDISEALGVCDRTIKRRLDGSFAAPKRRYAELNQYENRWDLITGALSTLTEANQIAQTPRDAIIDREAFLRP